MVKGLEIFREHFRDYADRYVLIGGAACDIAMTGAGLEFRATKDLDIVLYVEALDAAFVRAFWEFVRAGGYEVQEKSTGEKQFYRFQKPANADYPSCWSCSRGSPMCCRLPKAVISHHYRLKRISPAFPQFSWITTITLSSEQAALRPTESPRWAPRASSL
jgi:hypothetical protein